MSPVIKQFCRTVLSQNAPPGDAVARYETTVSPNAATGAVQEICVDPSPSDAVTDVGALGAAGTGNDAGPLPPRALPPDPAAFEATAENR